MGQGNPQTRKSSSTTTTRWIFTALPMKRWTSGDDRSKRVFTPRPVSPSRDYAYFRVAPGEYTVELWVDGTVLRGEAVILQDHWYDK